MRTTDYERSPYKAYKMQKLYKHTRMHVYDNSDVNSTNRIS